MAIVREVKSFPDFKVQIVTSFPDIHVYVTKNKSEARDSDCIWYFDEHSGDTKIQFVRSFPDLKIEYVQHKNQAGWRNKSHRLQNRIG